MPQHDEKDPEMPVRNTAKKTKIRSVGKSSTKKTERRKSFADRPRRAGSKQTIVIAQLSQPAGTTVAKIMQATGWQQHSVRGFLAAVVRKRLGLNLDSRKVDGNRVYRIAGADNAKAAPGNPSTLRSE
ncbi:MAG: DUF3489 domain-containing protein [Xanthobacteraceae bacterium]